MREDRKPKVVNNPGSSVIVQPTGFGSSADVELFNACQHLLEERGRSQRGISRRKDPARYPLALHIWDMTNGCGHPMYARTSGLRPLYVCGRYMKTDGAECDHNAVDGEAVLRFVVSVLQQRIEQLGGREALRRRLMRRATAPHAQPADELAEQELQRLQKQLNEAEKELELIGRNMARAKSDELYRVIEGEFVTQHANVDRLRQQCEKARSAVADRAQEIDPEAQVELALSLYDELENIVNDPAARAGIPDLLGRINLHLWLNFAEGLKGTRKVRVLKGGILTTGDAEPPVRPYGKDGDDPPEDRDGTGALPVPVGAKPPSVGLSGLEEGVSFTKGNRGDWI